MGRGDCNNVAFSWAEAARLLDFEFVVACPPEWRRPLPGEVVFVDSPVEAARGAAAVNTDVWVSMGDTEAAERRRVFAGFQVDAEVMAAARGGCFVYALFAGASGGGGDRGGD